MPVAGVLVVEHAADKQLQIDNTWNTLGPGDPIVSRSVSATGPSRSLDENNLGLESAPTTRNRRAAADEGVRSTRLYYTLSGALNQR